MVDLTTLPTTPGVYIYRNFHGDIIYVGKAINLKKRVSQYFQRDDALGPKTSSLVSQIDTVETRQVESELQALILESNLIKKYRPKFNSLMKDDKSYQYICITKESLPRVFSCFQTAIPDNCDAFGPYPGGSAIKQLLKSLRRIFPYRSQEVHPSRPCLYCHLHLCPGPNPDPKKYRRNIGLLKKVLRGSVTSIQKQLATDIKQYSKSEDFESAIVARNQLQSLNYIVSGWRQISSLYQHVNLPDDRSHIATNELVTVLNPYFPQLNLINRVECIDISQMGLKHFVGSMTVWQNGILDHSQYRQFKINTKITPDDQFMIREVLYRRLQHPEWGIPDLIVVDGGKPQVSSANQLIGLSLPVDNVPIIGLAKKLETIVILHQHQFEEINLPHNSQGLNLIRSLRDEAHRFANRYRKKLMQKAIK